MSNSTNVIVPPSASLVGADLYTVFNHLTTQLEALSNKVEANRTYSSSDADLTPVKNRNKCTLVCQKLQGQKRVQCLEQCSDPVVDFESLEEFKMGGQFEPDMKRIHSDPGLQRTVRRHQTAPYSIDEKDAATTIPEIYAMPFAVFALPETAWDRSMTLMAMPENTNSLKILVRNWKNRVQDYPDDARDELARKINRHDRSNVIEHAILQSESDSDR